MRIAAVVLGVALLAIARGGRRPTLKAVSAESSFLQTVLQTGLRTRATWSSLPEPHIPSVESKRAALLYIHKFLKDNSIEHVFIYGTSLGLDRDGDVIPQDDDVDVLVNLTHIRSLETSLRQAAIVESRWHMLTIVKQSPIDIYGFLTVAGGLCLPEVRHFWSNSLMWPPLYKHFPAVSANMSLPIPRNSSVFHATYYGKDWRRPSQDRSVAPPEEDRVADWDKNCQAEYERFAVTGVDDRRFQPRWAIVVFIALIIAGTVQLHPRIGLDTWRRNQTVRHVSSVGLCALYIGLLFGCGYLTNLTGIMAGEFAKPKMAVLEQAVQVQLTLVLWRLWDGSFIDLPGTLRRASPELLHFAGPAILYVLADVLLTFALRYMDGVSADALIALKVLPLAVVWQKIIGPRLQFVTWMGLALIVTGCVSWLSEHLGDALPAVGLSLLGLAALVLAAATLLHEWLLKRQPDVLATSVQTLALSVFGFLGTLLVWAMVEATGVAGSESQFSDPGQWLFLLLPDRPRPWFQLLIFGTAHVARAYVLKWTSTITGDACSAVSMMLAAMLTMPTFGSFLASAVGIVEAISCTLVFIGFGLVMYPCRPGYCSEIVMLPIVKREGACYYRRTPSKRSKLAQASP